MKNLSHKLAAIMTVGALSVSSESSFAFSGIATNVSDSVDEVPKLLSVVAYLGGIGLGISGILKLKEHVENPGNAPLKNGVVRLGMGGALLALPTVLSAMASSVGTDGGITFREVGASG